MHPVTTRIPEGDLDTLSELESELGADRAEVLRRLIRDGLDQWRTEEAIAGIREGRMTLRQAAASAEISYVELLGLVAEDGIECGYTDADLERDLRASDGRR